MSSTKHKAIRILAVIFAALMLVPLLAACSNNGNGDESSDPVGSTATTDTQETRLGTLPEKLDLGKATVAILYWSDVINPEFEVEETDRITSAIHAKDSRVQEMLNVNIEWTGEAGGKSKLENFKKRVEAGISTNESEVVAAHSMVMGALASSDICRIFFQRSTLILKIRGGPPTLSAFRPSAASSTLLRAISPTTRCSAWRVCFSTRMWSHPTFTAP